jgi:threonine dehydratase
MQDEIENAYARISPHLRRTPVEPSPWLAALTGAEVHCKFENYQVTGSFKARGALNRVLGVTDGEAEAGFVAASTGNHGAAVAYAARLRDAPVTVFVPSTADPEKVSRLRDEGVAVRTAGVDSIEAEAAAREFASSFGSIYVSPYNDPAVVVGQGTVGLELAEQLPDLDAVFVALGGGGLVAGIASYLKARRPNIEVIACSPRNSAVMAHSIEAGRILDLPSEPTLSDGTAGGVEAGSITFELCQQLVDRYELVDERAIGQALYEFTARHHSLIEGAAAVPIAALLALGRAYAGRQVAVVLCGANIATGTLLEVLQGETAFPD